MKLRGALKLRGVTTTEVDIWSTPEAAARVRDVADGRDAPVHDPYVGPHARRAGAVHDGSTADQEIKHGSRLPVHPHRI